MREAAAKVCEEQAEYERDQAEIGPSENPEYHCNTYAARKFWLVAKEIRAFPLPAEAGGWQSIETAPKDGEEIIGLWSAFDPPFRAIVFWTGGDDGGWTDGMTNSGWGAPSHWLPLSTLPSPPQEGGE